MIFMKKVRRNKKGRREKCGRREDIRAIRALINELRKAFRNDDWKIIKECILIVVLKRVYQLLCGDNDGNKKTPFPFVL